MVKGLLSYLVAFVIFSLCNLAGILATAPLVPLLRRFKPLLPFARLALDFAAALAAVFLIHWLSTVTGLRSAYAMALIPAFLWGVNGFRRLEAAKAGASGLRRMMAASSDAEDYDQAMDIRTERMSVVGLVAGYLVGLYVFFRGKSFF